jgi:outer membrane receptor protein involved in Fe transport
MSNRAEVAGKMERNRQLPQYIGNAGIYLQRRQLDFACFGKYTSAFENTRFAAPDANNIVWPQPLGDFITFDLTAGWSFGNTRFYFEIQNLTDEKFSTVVGYPDFGRRLTVGIRRVL